MVPISSCYLQRRVAWEENASRSEKYGDRSNGRSRPLSENSINLNATGCELMPSGVLGERLVGPSGETYLISDFLGRGAFGEVYRAVGYSSGTVIAVKRLPLGDLSERTSQQALLNEMRLGQEINHPNVIRLLHVDEGSNQVLGPYACMGMSQVGRWRNSCEPRNRLACRFPCRGPWR